MFSAVRDLTSEPLPVQSTRVQYMNIMSDPDGKTARINNAYKYQQLTIGAAIPAAWPAFWPRSRSKDGPRNASTTVSNSISSMEFHSGLDGPRGEMVRELTRADS